jgi:two-component system, cell cycle sensor histidine kinase and response regulator CckA
MVKNLMSFPALRLRRRSSGASSDPVVPDKRFRAIFDAAPVGIALADEQGRAIESNQALRDLLGYTVEELRARTYVDYTHPDDLPANLELSHQIVTGERASFQLEKRYLHRDSTPIWVRVNVARVQDATGNFEYAVVVVESIDERKLLEERLLQSQKLEAMGRLAGGVAHDFNNILTAITGYSDLLLARPRLPDEARSEVAEIKRAAQRAGALARQLLAFGRKQTLEPRVLALNEVVREIEAMLTRLIGEHIELRTTLADELGPVRVDPGQIEQVIVNLVLNARDAMPEGGTLTLATENVELDIPCVKLSVTDTGKGMDYQTAARIFEPFFTTKEAEKGTGLGLATVYGIVEQSGGHVDVWSRPGEGAVFTVVLPRADTPRPVRKPDWSLGTLPVAPDQPPTED